MAKDFGVDFVVNVPWRFAWVILAVFLGLALLGFLVNICLAATPRSFVKRLPAPVQNMHKAVVNNSHHIAGICGLGLIYFVAML